MNSFTRARLRLVGESALLTQQSLEVARHSSPQQLSGTAIWNCWPGPTVLSPPSPRRGGGWQPRARGCSRLVSSIRPRHSSCTHLSAQTRGFAQQSGTTSSARPTSTMRTCRCGKAPWPITCADVHPWVCTPSTRGPRLPYQRCAWPGTRQTPLNC